MSDEASAMLFHCITAMCAMSPTELQYVGLFFSGDEVVYN
jgi:hypothetical protein